MKLRNEQALLAALNLLHDLATEMSAVIDRHRQRLRVIAAAEAACSERIKPKDLKAQASSRLADIGQERLTVTVKEAKQMIGIGTSSIYKLINEGKLESTLVAGSRRVIYVSSLKKLVGIES